MSRFRVVGRFIAALTLATGPPAIGAETGRRIEDSSEAAAPQPTGTLKLAEALARALTASPELAPFSLEVRAAEARALQASLLPNPKAELLVEDVLGSGGFAGGRQAQVTLQLSQVVELGGKRAARVEAARRARDVAGADYEVKRVDVLAEVTKRFLDVVERQLALELAREKVELDEATLAVVRRRVRAGAGSPLEEKRAEVAAAQSRLAGEDGRHELDVARSVLVATWGAPTPAFERAEADLFARPTVPDWARVETAVGSSPEILRGAIEKRLREAEIRLAERRRIPDLTLIAGPRRLEGADETALVFGLSAPLPLFDRNHGAVAEAEALAGRAGAAQHAAEVRLRALLYRIWQQLSHAGHVLDVLDREILPASESTLALSREGFEGGRFSHLELLDAGGAFLEARRRRIEAAASFHGFVLEIERVTGAPIDGGEPRRSGSSDQGGSP